MGKLIGYEFRNTRKQFLQLILILMGASFIIQFLVGIFASGLLDRILAGDSELAFTIIPSLSVIITMIFLVVIVVTSVAYLVKLGSILKRDIYENQAYLMFSLPHSGYEIIGAKTIVGIVWSLIMPTVITLWNVLLGVFNAVIITRGNASIIQAIREFFSSLFLHFDLNAILSQIDVGVLVLFILSSIISSVFMVTIIYAAIVTDNRIGRKKADSSAWILYAIGFYIIWNIIVDIVLGLGDMGNLSIEATVGNSSMNMGAQQMFGNGDPTVTIINLVLSLLMSIVLYIYTSHIFEKKIEI